LSNTFNTLEETDDEEETEILEEDIKKIEKIKKLNDEEKIFLRECFNQDISIEEINENKNFTKTYLIFLFQQNKMQVVKVVKNLFLV
jgi:hypothetical protein